MAGCGLRHVEHACQVHGDHTIPLLRGNVQEFVPYADPGIVDENIYAVHQPDRFGEGGLDLHEICDIGDDGFAERRQFMLDACAGRVVAIEHAYA